MNLIIGRGGNQKITLKDPEIGALHCIVDEEDGFYKLQTFNFRATYIDDERIMPLLDALVVSENTKIRLGESFECEFKDLLPVFDYNLLTDWGVAANRFERILDIEVFLDYALPEETPLPVRASLKGCEAYFLINQGKFREAQEIIYTIGDEIYENQDGEMELKNAYLSYMILLFYLYKKAGLGAESQKVLEDVRKMIDSGINCSDNVVSLIK